jgi:ubiquinone/menaquinone biosynthesis C-methylase UbiE
MQTNESSQARCHALGRLGTVALAELAAVADGERVLDVGAGIGGPSRALARHFGAEVTALDPTPRFCRLADALNERCGLADRVAVVQGDGRTLPFEDRSFDLAWTQALWQSVEDKESLCAEIHRVLRPGGRLALFEVIAESSAALHYPVPWADGPAEERRITMLMAIVEAR